MILLVAAIALFAVRRNRASGSTDKRHEAPSPRRTDRDAISSHSRLYVAGTATPVCRSGDLLLAVALVGMFLTQNTTFGRYLYR